VFDHFTGGGRPGAFRPMVIVSQGVLPLPQLVHPPRALLLSGAWSLPGSGPGTVLIRSLAAPWAFPNGCPPAIEGKSVLLVVHRHAGRRFPECLDGRALSVDSGLGVRTLQVHMIQHLKGRGASDCCRSGCTCCNVCRRDHLVSCHPRQIIFCGSHMSSRPPASPRLKTYFRGRR